MRDVFPEYYRPSHEDLRRFASDATIVLDANVLLDLYRLGTSEREQVFSVLDKVKGRLWLPYQAGLEFQRGRLGVVSAQAGAYESVKALHGARSLKQMEEKLAGLNIPDEVRKAVQPLLSELEDKLRSSVGEYETRIEELASEHVVTVAQAKSEDPVRARLDILLAGRVGEKPDRKTHEDRIREGVRRSDAQIPPGYKDSRKEGEESKAGDYLLWTQILDYAKQSDGPLLFVTKDQKEDWFERISGEITGPRTELVAEFGEYNGHGYHQVTLGSFLDLANEFLRTRVERATIERVSRQRSLRPDATVALNRMVPRFSPEQMNMIRLALQVLSQRDIAEAIRQAAQIGIPPEAAAWALQNVAAESYPVWRDAYTAAQARGNIEKAIDDQDLTATDTEDDNDEPQ